MQVQLAYNRRSAIVQGATGLDIALINQRPT